MEDQESSARVGEEEPMEVGGEDESGDSSLEEGGVQTDRSSKEVSSSLEGSALVDHREGSSEPEEVGLDVARTAEEYAQYLVVNSKQDKQVLDERIETVVSRVEEFKRQLEWMHQNITSCSGKMQELYEHTQQLKDLYNRIDQLEAFLSVVHRNVDSVEESISRAERELDPSKFRKVLSSLPKLRKNPKPPTAATTGWQPPRVFDTKNYFRSPAASSPLGTFSQDAGRPSTAHSPS